jgi:hypothetical protein
MELAFGFALFVVGFAMFMAGVALLIAGEITFKSGRKITKPVGRKAAILLLSFFPAAAIVVFIFRKIVTDPSVPSAVVTWPLALAWLFLSGIWLLRGMKAAAPRRGPALPAASIAAPAASSSAPIVLEFDAPTTSPAPSPGNIERPPPRGKNPFDFS